MTTMIAPTAWPRAQSTPRRHDAVARVAKYARERRPWRARAAGRRSSRTRRRPAHSPQTTRRVRRRCRPTGARALSPAIRPDRASTWRQTSRSTTDALVAPSIAQARRRGQREPPLLGQAALSRPARAANGSAARVAIVGAGTAGLTAALTLQDKGLAATVHGPGSRALIGTPAAQRWPDRGTRRLPDELLALVEALRRRATVDRSPHRQITSVAAARVWPAPSYGTVEAIIRARDSDMNAGRSPLPKDGVNALGATATGHARRRRATSPTHVCVTPRPKRAAPGKQDRRKRRRGPPRRPVPKRERSRRLLRTPDRSSTSSAPPRPRLGCTRASRRRSGRCHAGTVLETRTRFLSGAGTQGNGKPRRATALLGPPDAVDHSCRPRLA
jgi:hypothetical protein